MFSIDGIVSGFDSSGIIDSLLGFQQSQIDTFNSRKSEISTKQSLFKGIEAQLLTMQTSIGRLNRTQASVFDVKSATSSNEDILEVAADGKATVGSYKLTVNSLATAHQVGSQGFSTTSDQISSGDITFQVGDRAASTITIDQSNNTVSGLVSAINDQVDDVSASVIFDQGGSSYRILLTSQETGVANEISVTSNLAGAGATPDFSGPAVQEAADAIITLGSGPGAISAQFASNKVEDLIENVSIDLKSADAGQTISIDISADTGAAKEAIESFVADFNSVIDFIEGQTKFNPETNQASPLLGNRSVSNIKNKLLSAVTDTVASAGALSRLAQIGIDVNTQGKLIINGDDLTKALAGDLEGVDADEIRNLFGLNAVSDNSGIEYLAGGTRTRDSNTPYEVDITQAAEQGTITATNAAAASIDIDNTNNTFQITLDGIVSETLTLSDGTYTSEELAAHLENTIGNSTTLGVHNVSVSLSGSNELVITSEAYGSASRVASFSGAAAATLGFDGTEADSGQDVAGVFIVNGVEEIANGSGRVLSGHPDNENTADLQLRVTLTSDRIVAGSDGTVQVSRGVSGRLDVYLNSIMDGETGLLKTVDDEFKSKIASIDKSIKRVEEITEKKRAYLIAEFTALESIISELQNTGSFISSQLQSISSFSNKK